MLFVLDAATCPDLGFSKITADNLKLFLISFINISSHWKPKRSAKKRRWISTEKCTQSRLGISGKAQTTT